MRWRPGIWLDAAKDDLPHLRHGGRGWHQVLPELRREAGAATSAEVRKTVTILFSDVSGSTALGEQLDPESLRALMSRYFREMQRSSSGTAGGWRSSSGMR